MNTFAVYVPVPCTAQASPIIRPLRDWPNRTSTLASLSMALNVSSATCGSNCQATGRP
jgi:hypothetical protein